ncbi:urea ABC transporter permease subunit UrtB [Halomonas sp. McH1-25]|uniref:urea ABC transporter permease subunit UrtB n=1 Tax=unclassified Halomonas TaxID=2609666 RepID=UPI001EF678CC|nr:MULTISPECIES: urea ABC transporter permease subunit UrtB [unclassified Halomonas]MCG7600043.1 urea ABC transporter permease subunit UrtB [Halomonas sp. McH1-25]MCP1344138.1 urea ABC transporter permease subunit UrtB [Halomonas sp. FL8]MCP1363381.1 urea ABC transporter permease subunit UrtB [Halomonas sp. BBD45]MCP1366006.1 urea ABC transporter permease subunit UrtB [Halomonas sp. BBD48]
MNLLRTIQVSLLFWCCVALTFPVLAQQIDAADQDAPPELVALASDSYAAKGEAIQALIASGHSRTRTWLTALLDGKLQRLEDSGRFVIVTDNSGRDWTVIDAVDDAPLGEVSRRNIDRITINNALRNQLRSAMAVLDLDAPTVQERLASADRLLGKVDANLAEPLTARLDAEESPAVREKLAQALAIYRLQSGDSAAVNAAIDTLSGSLNPAVRAALNGVAAGEGEAAEAAQRALASIEQKLKLNRAAQTLYFGLSLGSVLVLAAIGLAITFGVMGVINMAHGELIMLGAYTTWMMQQLLPGQPGLALILSIPAGFLVAAIAGIIIERSVIRFLKGRPLETLLATFGVSLILQQLVRTLISPLNRTVVTPEWMSGSLVINEALSLTLNRLYVLGFALVVFAGLMLVMRKTRLGLEVRAVTQNRAMARAMGIRATRVDIMTFALGSGVAGLAGVALSQLTNVGPNLGQSYIIDSFMVVVFGGVGNLWGTLVAGMSLGVINQVLEPWAGAILAKIIVLVFIILFIQKRPRGLFPQKGRAAEG